MKSNPIYEENTCIKKVCSAQSLLFLALQTTSKQSKK